MVSKFDKLMVIKLYRADHKGNTTNPELFPSNGLITKQCKHGNPVFYKDYGWLKSIKSHINHDNKLEENIYNSSSFLSFSKSKAIVQNVYLNNSGTSTVEKINCFQQADRFIFIFEFVWEDFKQINTGVYSFEYYCNYEKFSFLLDPILKISISCKICRKIKNYKHQLLVIDVVKYLTDNYNKLEDVDGALKNAKRDEEWLIIPIDPMLDGIGFQSRIPVADFLDVEFYKNIK